MFRLQLIIGLFLLGFYACQEKYEVEDPTLDVTTDKTEYNVGDSVVFYLHGNPDLITFYSGESGHEYRYRDRLERESGKTEVEFISRVLWGTQPDNLQVMVSSDFGGEYDSISVVNASWTNVSDRFTLSTAAGGAAGADTPSGKVDLSDLIVSGKPFYFAFQYKGRKAPDDNPTAKTQRTWRIVNFNMTATFEDSEVSTLANLSSAGWIAVDVIKSVGAWAIASPVQFNPNGCLTESESWAISKPLYPNKTAPDNGLAVKNYSQRRESFRHAYQEPGTYTVTFEASNANFNGQKTIVREMTITVK